MLKAFILSVLILTPKLGKLWQNLSFNPIVLFPLLWYILTMAQERDTGPEIFPGSPIEATVEWEEMLDVSSLVPPNVWQALQEPAANELENSRDRIHLPKAHTQEIKITVGNEPEGPWSKFSIKFCRLTPGLASQVLDTIALAETSQGPHTPRGLVLLLTATTKGAFSVHSPPCVMFARPEEVSADLLGEPIERSLYALNVTYSLVISSKTAGNRPAAGEEYLWEPKVAEKMIRGGSPNGLPLGDIRDCQARRVGDENGQATNFFFLAIHNEVPAINFRAVIETETAEKLS
jgi:hypothetical protein